MNSRKKVVEPFLGICLLGEKAIMIQVEGRIPARLEGGLYLRTGANPRCWPPSGLFLKGFGSLGFRSCSCIWGGCHAAQGELRSRRQRSCWRGLQQFLDPTASTDSLWTLRRCWGPSHWRSCSSSDAHPGGDGKPRWGWAAHHGKDGSWGDLSRSTGLSCMPQYGIAT